MEEGIPNQDLTPLPDPSERRQHARFNANFRVDLLESEGNPVPDTIRGKAVNISHEGLGMKILYDVPIGSRVSLAIYLGGRDSICLCTVVWKKKTGEQTYYGLQIKHWGFLDPFLKSQLAAIASRTQTENPFSARLLSTI